MTTHMQAALAQLNSATERQYTIRQEGDNFTLCIPTGGHYPPVEAGAMMHRLVTLKIAANGRGGI